MAGPPFFEIDHNLSKLVGAVFLVEANKMREPSLVQPRTLSVLGCQVICLASPPSVGTTKTSLDPFLFDVNAIHFPSGEKCGSRSTAAVLVIL